ncbi:MAG: substrate-binding domain-containing protein [Rhodospirillales bacterium]|nr:MAG: substrate-binding domain-containing protein [Rhodospirillales bacterium]
MRLKYAISVMTLALAFGAGSANAASEELTIVGTGDGIPILQSLGSAFSQMNPDVRVNVPPSIGSGGGIKAVGNEEFMLGRVARPIKGKESHFGLTYQPIAKVPVVFFVNPNVGVRNLTADQIAGIYGGRITNWNEVGGPNMRIRVVRREDGDSSLGVLRKTFPGFKELAITPKAKEALTTQENFELVERKGGTIGFGPYSGAVKSNVQILTVDGVAPTAAGYPSATVIALIYKEKYNKGAVNQFLGFATSPAAADAIRNANGLPY